MISVDPGVNGHGWAIWDNGVLQLAGYGHLQSFACERHFVLIELPQVYTASKSKGNPNDLIRLAFAAGAQASKAKSYETVSPRKWKGTIKKKIMLKRILAALTVEELAVIRDLGLPADKEHNVVDAVGIGLWHLKRL